MPDYDDDFIRGVLTAVKVIAVVGASPKPDRPSHRVTKFLIDQGYTVYPVNPALKGEPLFGRPSFSSLAEVPEPIHMVDIFRRSEDVGPIVDEAIEVSAKVIWMQLGVINEDAAARAQAAGLTVIMDRCPAIEIPRLGL